jgi:hypothetical protein
MCGTISHLNYIMDAYCTNFIMTEHLEPEKEQDYQPTLQDNFTPLFEAGPQFKDNFSHDIEAENIHQIFQQILQLDNQIFSLNLQIDTDNKIIHQEKTRSQKKVFLLSFSILFVMYLSGVRYFSHDWIDALCYALLGLIPGLTLFTVVSEGISWICRKTHFWKWKKKQGGDEILQHYDNLKEQLSQTYEKRDVFYQTHFTEQLYFQSLFAYDEMVEHIKNNKTYTASFYNHSIYTDAVDLDAMREKMKQAYLKKRSSEFFALYAESEKFEDIIQQAWLKFEAQDSEILEEKYLAFVTRELKNPELKNII